jgi:sarcosine oxidase subunit beta
MTQTPSLDSPIAVIGAGIIGCSTAWHLLKAGARKVTVYDAGQAGSATTSAGAGFVSQWSAGMMEAVGEPGLVLQNYGIEFYKALDKRRSIGCRANGSLYMALTKNGFERFVRPTLDHPLAPAEMQTLSAAEIGEVTSGAVDPAQVYGGALNPHGIQLETNLAIAALAHEIRDLGGTFRENVRVERLDSDETGVRLTTSQGEEHAAAAVVALGGWNNDLLEPLGWRLPLLRVLATRIVTQDLGLSPTMPTIQCREIPIWIREKSGGFTWGTTDGYSALYRLEAGRPRLEPGQPKYPELVDRLLERRRSQLDAIFPALKRSEVVSWSQGMPIYTPDGNLFAGPVPGHARIFAAGGDNEAGVSHGPGLGRLLSEMALGRPTVADPSGWRLDRFNPKDFPDEASVEAQSPILALIKVAA